MSRIRLVALVLVASALASSGCGSTTKSSNQTAQSAPPTSSTSTTSSSSTTQPSTRPLTREQLIAKADAICFAINAKRNAITITRIEDFGRVIPPFAAYDEAAVAELRKLTPPASMAEGWKQIVTSAKEFADAVTKFGEYTRIHKTNNGTHSLNLTVIRATREMNTVAKREGFKDCAKT
jgi:hypothetical protein